MVLLLGGFSLFLAAGASRVPPSAWFLNEEFSARLWEYRHKPQQDYLILGNSRSMDGIDPNTLAKTLSGAKGGPVSVHSLGVGGGFFPFYYEQVTGLIPDRLPKTVILGVSPRDFSRHDYRKNKVRDLLLKSSGYRLMREPYIRPVAWLEGWLTDLLAGLFPALQYRTRVAENLFEFKPLPTGVAGLSELTGLLLPSGATYPSLREWSSGELAKTSVAGLLADYRARLKTIWGARPAFGGEVDNNGWTCRGRTTEEHRARAKAKHRDWLAGDHRKFRFSERCPQTYGLETRPGSAQRRFFDYLAERGVKLVLVLMPALKLEACENSQAVNVILKEYLETLPRDYPNILGTIDLNNNFNHPYSDPALYKDLEHLNCDGAALVSAVLGQRIRELESRKP